MAFDPGSLGQRILFCRAIRLSDGKDVRDRLTQTAFGIGVAHRMGRKRDFPAATVSRWESDLAVPDLVTIGAIARSAKVDPGWLAFGAASNAPTPIDGMTEDQRRYAFAFLEIAKQDLESANLVAELRKQHREEIRKGYARLADMKKAMRRK